MKRHNAGPCPVCGESSFLAFLKATDSNVVFFFCDACGCAWGEHPASLTVDSVDPIEKYAPKGHSYATLEEIRAAGYEALIK